MPARNNNKRNNKKKSNRRGRNFGRGRGRGRGRMKIERVNLRNTIVPDRTTVRMKVSSLVTFQFSSLAFYASYKGNGLVNPGNGTWVNQPASFIDWMIFYQNFRVLGSKIIFKFVNDGDDPRNRADWVTIYPSRVSDASTLSGGAFNAETQAYSRIKQVGSPTGQDRCTISNSMGTSKIWGYNVYDDVDFTGTVDTDPVNLWYWAIACSGLSDGGTNFPIITGIVTIIYTVQLFNRKPITMTFPGLTDLEAGNRIQQPYLMQNRVANIDIIDDHEDSAVDIKMEE